MKFLFFIFFEQQNKKKKKKKNNKEEIDSPGVTFVVLFCFTSKRALEHFAIFTTFMIAFVEPLPCFD